MKTQRDDNIMFGDIILKVGVETGSCVVCETETRFGLVHRI